MCYKNSAMTEVENKTRRLGCENASKEGSTIAVPLIPLKAQSDETEKIAKLEALEAVVEWLKAGLLTTQSEADASTSDRIPLKRLLKLKSNELSLLKEFVSIAKSLVDTLFEVQQSRLFESLIPAYAKVPIKRVFLFAMFVADDFDLRSYEKLTEALDDVLEGEFLGRSPALHGSSPQRSLYQTSKHQTLDEFQASQRQLAEELVSVLREHQIQNITINLYPPLPKAEPKEWTGKFKDMSEALKNLLLVGAGCSILLGGTLIISSKRETPEKPLSVTVKQIAPKDQLELLPMVLEANTPEDFAKAISEVRPAAPPKEKPKRKFL
jgi:hypothetical protein